MARSGEPRDASLDPAVLDRLSSLSLVARTVVEGFMAGQHRSPHRGSSVEFAQHRQYVPGDELKHVDWQIFARSNRLVVKEFVEETNFGCHILVDASESMSFTSGRWTKLDYARWCAAALAFLVIGQRDAAGLVVFDDDVRTKVPPSNGAHQKSEIVQALEETEPHGATGVGDVLSWIGGRLNRRGIVIVLSDFFEDLDRLVHGMRQLTHAGHEPILLQIVDPQELEFDYERLLRLDGLEGLGRLKVDPKSLRAAYRQAIRRHRDEIARQARSLSLDFVSMSTSTPVDIALSTYLARRAARARRS